MKRVRIPAMLVDLVMSALTSVDGAVFMHLEACPYCGGRILGHDIRKKRFATIIEDGDHRNIYVLVKRFHCTECGRLCYADAPFYPDTRLASPIVDFCRLQSATMPYHRVARVLEAMGIVIDRGTVRNYAALDVGDIPYTELFGIRMPLSLLNLSVSAVSRGKGGTIEGAEALAACGFPSARRAASGSRPPSKERDQRNKEKEKEERNIQQQH